MSTNISLKLRVQERINQIDKLHRVILHLQSRLDDREHELNELKTHTAWLERNAELDAEQLTRFYIEEDRRFDLRVEQTLAAERKGYCQLILGTLAVSAIAILFL